MIKWEQVGRLPRPACLVSVFPLVWFYAFEAFSFSGGRTRRRKIESGFRLSIPNLPCPMASPPFYAFIILVLACIVKLLYKKISPVKPDIF
jgi:hypothetical protein